MSDPVSIEIANPELPVEQKYIDRAFACLTEGQGRARQMIDEEHAGGNRLAVRKLHQMGEELLHRRTEAEDRICFASIDSDSGKSLYIGRELIHDGAEPVVISWHVPAAVPYYEADPDNPLGLVRKRRFELDGRKLVALDDEVLRELPLEGRRVPSESQPARPPKLRDALLRELERARSAEMKDIVPTIEREQFQLIRVRITTGG